MHVDDSDLALTGGLYNNDYNYASYNILGFYAFDDFLEFGRRIGLVPQRVKRMLLRFLQSEEAIFSIIKRSFLADEMKMRYINLYEDKRKRLATTLTGQL